jgi:hypothetical protein
MADGKGYFMAMSIGRRTLSLLSALAFASLAPPEAMPLAAQVAFFPPDDRVSIETEASLDEKSASFEAYCAQKGATLYIDGDEAGQVPCSGKLALGSRHLELDLPGYYPIDTWIYASEKTHYTLHFAPSLITGFISLSIHPEGASVFLDGVETSERMVEAAAGKHRLLVRSFGYAEKAVELEVSEKATSSITLQLDEAPFSIHDLAFSRESFNPLNRGAAGKTALGFAAMNRGSARAEIRGPDGALVASLEFPDIESWSQSREWDGRGEKGEALPDGVYTATLIAKPASGGTDGAITLTAKVEIDSSLVVRVLGSAAAIPGLLLMPDPRPQGAGSFAAETSWFVPAWSPEASVFELSMAYSAGGVAILGFDAAAELSGGGLGGDIDLGASATIPLSGDAGSFLSCALFARCSYSSSDAPTLPGAGSALELSLPLAAALAALGDTNLILSVAPGACADLTSSRPSYLGLARGGLWLEGPSFRTGISAALPVDFSNSLLSPSRPAILALEVRMMPGSSPLVVAGSASASLARGEDPSWTLGFGLGLLF